MDKEQFGQAWGKIVAKAWSDEAFKKRLLSEPNAVLKENGVDIPAGVQFKIMEDTDQLCHISLPNPPDSLDLNTLEKAAGGVVTFIGPSAKAR